MKRVGIGNPKILDLETSWRMMMTVETMRKRDRRPVRIEGDCDVDFDRLEVDLEIDDEQFRCRTQLCEPRYEADD
jgi:hypothetical protein